MEGDFIDCTLHVPLCAQYVPFYILCHDKEIKKGCLALKPLLDIFILVILHVYKKTFHLFH